MARTYLKIPRVRDGVYLGAVLDGARRRVLYVHKVSDGDEMPPNRPVPSGRRQDGPGMSEFFMLNKRDIGGPS
jgi:hypothetical protein